MKILTFTSLYPNAAQPTHGVFVENRLRKLVASGDVESRVVAPVPWFPVPLGRYANAARVPRHEQRHGITISHPRFFTIPKVGMAVSPDFMARGAWRDVNDVIDSGFDFDIVDAHYFYPDGIAAALIAKKLGKPLVITARGSDINVFPDYRVARRRIVWAAKQTDHIITVSSALRKRLIDLGVESEKISVLRNGVDLDVFAPRDKTACRQSLDLHDPTLLMAGGLVAIKGHRLVIEALADMPGWNLIIAGDGPEKDALQRQARMLGVSERVRFLGVVAHQSLPELYNAANILVLASSHEGVPNVLLEAMACGTPVVATDVGGCAEVVTNPNAGVIVKERNPAALKAAIEALWKNMPDRNQTRDHAEQFDWAGTISKKKTLIHRLWAQHTSSTLSSQGEYSSLSTEPRHGSAGEKQRTERCMTFM
jgi:glycosyltransferase involved in cell wall biosynthesis